MKPWMLLAALVLSGSSATSLRFAPEAGATRTYEVTLSLWVWNRPNLNTAQGQGGVAPTVEGLKQRRDLRPITVTCRMLEVVDPATTEPTDGSRGVNYTTTCRSSDPSLLALESPRTERFVYEAGGSVGQTEPEIRIESPPWLRIGGAQRLERTPWGDLPALYGPALEDRVVFEDNLRGLLGDITPVLNGTVSRTLRAVGRSTSVLVNIDHPAAVIGAPDAGSPERLLEPLKLEYRLLLGPDGRLERGSYQARINHQSGSSHTVGLLLAEIRVLGR